MRLTIDDLVIILLAGRLTVLALLCIVDLFTLDSLALALVGRLWDVAVLRHDGKWAVWDRIRVVQGKLLDSRLNRTPERVVGVV